MVIDMHNSMTRLEAWYRRAFCHCFPIYKIGDLKIGDVYWRLKSQPIEYVYVGKGLLWIKNKPNYNNYEKTT